MEIQEYQNEFTTHFYKVPYSFFHGFEFEGLRGRGGAEFVGFFLLLFFSAIDRQNATFVGKGSLQQYAQMNKLTIARFDDFLEYCLETNLLNVEKGVTNVYKMPMAQVYLQDLKQRKESYSQRGKMGAEAKKNKTTTSTPAVFNNDIEQYYVDVPGY